MLTAKPMPALSSRRSSSTTIRAAIAEPQAPSKVTGGQKKLKIGINGKRRAESGTSAVISCMECAESVPIETSRAQPLDGSALSTVAT